MYRCKLRSTQQITTYTKISPEIIIGTVVILIILPVLKESAIAPHCPGLFSCSVFWKDKIKSFTTCSSWKYQREQPVNTHNKWPKSTVGDSIHFALHLMESLNYLCWPKGSYRAADVHFHPGESLISEANAWSLYTSM